MFIDEVTVDRSSSITSEVTQKISNQDFLRGKKCNILQWLNQSPQLNPTKKLSVIEDKTEGRKFQICLCPWTVDIRKSLNAKYIHQSTKNLY